MDRKLIAFFTFLGLFGTFGAVSLMVIISGRHPFFVEKKLRIGAIILSLSGFAAGCNSIIGPTCYSPAAPENQILLDQATEPSGEIVVAVSSADTLTGSIDWRSGDEFSFALKDGSGTIIDKSDLLPADGAFDGSSEMFRIVFDKSPGTGVYSMEFYCCQSDSIKTSTPALRRFTLTITD